jgi:V8-like Glu-specific endopeptidase
MRRLAAERKSLATRAQGGAGGGDDDEPVSNPPMAAETAAVGRRGAEPSSAAAPRKGQTETPFRGWPGARAESTPEGAAPGGQLLDAWHATYSTAATVALLRRDRSMAESVMEVIVDQDDREQVTDTTAFPFRCICSLTITAQDGSKWIGTGWLAGPSTVVTAGHCVFLHGSGGWPARIDVFPARNGPNKPYAFTSTSFRSVKGWTRDQKPANDYGAIILPQPAVVGFFGYKVMTDEELSGRVVSVYGYPSDKEPGTLWGHYRQLTQILPRQLVYNIATIGGQSGAPVWDKDGEDRFVVGIHNYGDVSGNSATRITAAVYDNIDAWKAQTA